MAATIFDGSAVRYREKSYVPDLIPSYDCFLPAWAEGLLPTQYEEKFWHINALQFTSTAAPSDLQLCLAFEYVESIEIRWVTDEHEVVELLKQFPALRLLRLERRHVNQYTNTPFENVVASELPKVQIEWLE